MRVLLLTALAAGLLGLPTDAETPAPEPALETAIFAGGCFWCMEPPFEKLPGVRDVVSGYTGGHDPDPTYEEVSTGGTGHTEAVQVTYDPRQVTYAKLLDVFWHNVDPLDARGQFCDKGPQYRPGIFARGDAQRALAEKSLADLAESGRFEQPIAVQVEPAGTFYPAEDYHQDYAEKNPLRYRFYRAGCGRDARLEAVWGDAAGGH